MREFLKRYKIELETIGPVHIGSGQTLTKREWMLDWSDQKAIIVDFYKFFELLQQKKLLKEYERYASASGGDLLHWMKEHDISRRERYEIARYTLDTDGLNLKNQRIHDMVMTVKDPYGLPYIPGSSLKGALRNVLLTAMLDGQRYNTAGIKDEIRSYHRSPKAFLNKESAALNQQVFHTKGISDKKSDAVNDMMSGLRISDSNSAGLDRLTLCQKIDAFPDGRTRDLPLVRECIIPGTRFAFDLTIDQTETELKIEFIKHAISEFLKEYNQYFLANFPEENQYQDQVLYLGGGTGFPTKTVMNQIFRNDPMRVKMVADALNKLYPNKHNEDVRRGISPRVVKLTEVERKLLQMGPCRVHISAV